MNNYPIIFLHNYSNYYFILSIKRLPNANKYDFEEKNVETNLILY